MKGTFESWWNKSRKVFKQNVNIQSTTYDSVITKEENFFSETQVPKEAQVPENKKISIDYAYINELWDCK